MPLRISIYSISTDALIADNQVYYKFKIHNTQQFIIWVEVCHCLVLKTILCRFWENFCFSKFWCTVLLKWCRMNHMFFLVLTCNKSSCVSIWQCSLTFSSNSLQTFKIYANWKFGTKSWKYFISLKQIWLGHFYNTNAETAKNPLPLMKAFTVISEAPCIEEDLFCLISS